MNALNDLNILNDPNVLNHINAGPPDYPPQADCFSFAWILARHSACDGWSAERKKKESALPPLRLSGEIYTFAKTVFEQE